MIELVAVILGSVTTALIALTVYAKNSQSITSKFLIGLAIGLIGWSITNYLSINTSDDNATLFWIRLIMFFVIVQNTSFFFLVKVFPNSQTEIFKQKRYIAGLVFSALTAIVALSPLLFVGFKDGAPVPGPGMILFIPHALIFALGGLIILIRRYWKASGALKTQLRYFLFGTLLMFTLVPIGNFIVPIVFKENLLVSLSPLYSIVFTGSIAYAIIRHHLFDLRLVVARSVLYILFGGTLVGIYALVVFVIGNQVLSENADTARQIVPIVTALILVATAPYFKNLYNNLTRTIFYRDGYDPQEFLDKLNASIVSNIEIGILLRRATAIIEENIKSGFVQIIVPKTESTEERIVGTKQEEYTDHELNYLRGRLVGLGQKIVTIDDLSEAEDELRGIMQKHSISVLVHLSATSYGQYQTIAFMVLGDKKSGNLYTKSDLRIIDIIADELVIAIQNALRYEEIQEFNVTLQSKVNTATNKLKKTNEKLKSIDETKDEFISMASHQLRTPLTSVKGYLSMVLEGDAGDISPEQKKLLDQAFVSSQRMVYLIADLLNVSRLKTGKFIIDAEGTDLAEVVNGEVSQLKEQAKAKNIGLSYDKPKDFPILKIDETKTRQVIMNFIDNALYYTQSGGKIEVELKQDKSHVYFTVKDNGLGVPEKEKKHLFEKFYRAKNARNIRPDGTGLGLFMAKKVITAQGGNMLFESKEGKGSTFGFSFSLKHLRVDDEKEQDTQG